jgi:predicted RecB family nuclease
MITNRIVEHYLACRRKAHLALSGASSAPHEYELFTSELQDERRPMAGSALLHHCGLDTSPRIPIVTREQLKMGHAVILDCSIEQDQFLLHLDALFRNAGPSLLGSFHYVPVMFILGNTVRDEHKLILAAEAVLLSRIQDTKPAFGLYVLGQTHRVVRTRLATRHERADRLLSEMERLAVGNADPGLRLNRHCDVCEFRDRCSAEAEKNDDLSRLRGMSDTEVTKLNAKGIFTVTQLSYTFRPPKKHNSRGARARKRQFPLQALAIREGKLFMLDSPDLPKAAVHVYLDFEGDQAGRRPYLAGAIIASEGERKCLSLWSDGDGQDILDLLLAEICFLDNYAVFHYGTYEHDCLTACRNAANAEQIDGIIAHSCNVLSLVYNHAYFPTYSNGLKDIGKFLGCSWPPPIASGSQTLYWRHRWELTHDDKYKTALVAYNQHDCLALERLTRFLYRTIESRAVGEVTADGEPPAAMPAYVEDEARKSHWNYRSPLFPDFDHINKCAYFDYQREHVFVRSDKRLRRRQAKRRAGRRARVRANRRCEITSPECPECGGQKFTRQERRRSKWAFDLIVSTTGIRRHVTQCIASQHTCQTCGLIFVPERYKRLDKHGHALKSWAMFQHIVHCMSTHTLEEMVGSTFSLPVHSAEFLDMRDLLAVWYRDTCSEILAALKAGPLIHIDETPVTTKTGKGYVWVLASLHEVMYPYRPNREGGFLTELLQGFTGVLVSDFYAAYDSLPCFQQKCLVHLIRDINSDLIKNPFDGEFKDFVSRFSGLMRTIVATIDTVGLRKRALGKHRRAADSLVREVAGASFSSATMQAYKKRFEHYGDRMFTFLDHDGVPWNNAHAEHAIRRFANYRNKADGYLTIQGLEAHLALLSVFQTCAYRDVNFLDFLLSREKALLEFSQTKRRKRLPPTLGVYPDGFVPGNRRSKGSDGRLRGSVDRRIRITYLRKSGKAIPEIMEQLGVSHETVVRALRSGKARRRTRLGGKQ